MSACAPTDLAAAAALVRADPDTLDLVFPAARRLALREGLDPDRARERLLLALPDDDELAARLRRAYDRGDPQEKRAVLAALPALDDDARRRPLGDAGLPIVRDALRTNDPRLVAAAVGPYARARLDGPAWRQAVLKLVFMGVPLAVVDGLEDRADDELARMAADLADERSAAGREVPQDVVALAARRGPAPPTALPTT